MKKLTLIFLSALLCFCTCFSLNYIDNSAKFTSGNINASRYIIIDAGHGGLDNGTSASDGTKEKDINLSIAKTLYDYLMVCGIPAVMTRYDDYEVYKEGEERKKSDLYNRLDYINSFNDAIMVSIHQNFYKDEKEWGMQIWYSTNDENSKALADEIQNMNNCLLSNTNGRLIKKSTDDYYILYKAKHPSIMIECGFMSNRAENEKLKSSKYQQNISFAILLGLNKYIGR